MWFDAKAALAKLEREDWIPASPASSASSVGENVPQLAELAELAAPPHPEQYILDSIPILINGRPDHELTAAKWAVMAFMDNHLDEAHRIGWTDLELFGCFPVQEFARHRYDYCGAVILAAMFGKSIEQITELAAHYENGLVYYRKRPMPADAVPVWELARNGPTVALPGTSAFGR